MAVGSIQPLTEMNTRNISCRVKAAGAEFLYVWEPQTPQDLYWDSFTFIFTLLIAFYETWHRRKLYDLTKEFNKHFKRQ